MVKRFGKILFSMYAVTAAALFLLALLVQKFGWQERGTTVGICIVCVISCFLGGFLAGKVQKTRKFLWGLLAGSLYIAVMCILTLFVKKGFAAGFGSFLWSAFLSLGSGMLGGMTAP